MPRLHFIWTWYHAIDSSWNVMAHGNARRGKWRGNWRMELVASTLHTTSEHGVSSITTADAHTSAASSGLNWRAPCRFNWTGPFPRMTKSGFCACAITFRTQSKHRFDPKFRKNFSTTVHGVILATRFVSGYDAAASSLRTSVPTAPISRPVTSVSFRAPNKHLVVKPFAADADGKLPVTSCLQTLLTPTSYTSANKLSWRSGWYV